MKKQFLVLLTAAILSVFLTTSAGVKAQDDQPPQPMDPNAVTVKAKLHARLTAKALEALPTDVGEDMREMVDVQWNEGEYNGKPAVVAGAFQEDFDGTLPWHHHSWDPDFNDYWAVEFGGERGTALDWADFYFRDAVAHYRRYQEDNTLLGERRAAYYQLGRATHLLGDMGTPAHVLLDKHGPYPQTDSYESHTENFTAPPGAQPDYKDLRDDYSTRSEVENLLGGQVEHYDGVQNSAQYLWSLGPLNVSYPPYENRNIRVNTDLFHIFWDMAEFTDEFRSDDVEGEGDVLPYNPPLIGIIDKSIAETDLDEYAARILPKNVSAITNLLQLFWDTTHSPIYPLEGCSAQTLPANDDGSTSAVGLPFALNFFGNTYGALFVNNNGNVTFDSALGTFTPFPLSSTNRVIIAPFFADVDTRVGSVVTYGEVQYGSRPAFCVNWDDVGVGYFSLHIDKLNNFQLLLVERSDIGAGDFDIYMNYDRIEWETGDASGGSGGLDGSSARIGYSNGSTISFEYPGSGINGAFLDSNSSTGLISNNRNSDKNGRYLYEVRNGAPPEEGRISGLVSTGVTGNLQPLGGAFIQACTAAGGCNTTITNESGEYSVVGLAGGQYTLTAFPPSGYSNLSPGTLGPVSLATGQALGGQDILLTGPTAPPPGTSIASISTTNEGVPVVYWNQDLALTTQACANGTATYQVLHDGNVISSGAMSETPAGSGNYEAFIPPLIPNSGVADVEIAVDCPGTDDVSISFNIYIDPSGLVKDQNGDPLADATVTLLRSDSSSGPFQQVPNGSALMSPSNRTNPDLTNADGSFGWDVIAGYYTVRAEKEGCVSPENAQQNYVETDVLTIPPPVTDLVLTLDCSADPGETRSSVYITESFLTSRVEEGLLVGEGSKSCHWLTLSDDLGDGEVVVDIGAPQFGQVTVNKTSVTLDSSNWDNLTTNIRSNFVCIRPVDDAIDDGGAEVCKDGNEDMLGGGALVPDKECGDHMDAIQHSIASATADGFDTSTPIRKKTADGGEVISGLVEVLVQDDDTAGVTLSQSYGVSDVDEIGSPVAKACYWVTLDSQPTADVTVSITTDGQVTVQPAPMVLNANNWNALGEDGNKVCIFPQDDNLVEGTPNAFCANHTQDLFGQGAVDGQVCGSHLGHVNHTVNSGDSKYDGASVPFNGNGPDLDGGGARQIDVPIRDDDVAGVAASPAGLNVLEGETVTYALRLTAQPADDVEVAVGLGEMNRASTNVTSVTFTPKNWYTEQNVSLSIANNDTAEGVRAQTLQHAMRSSDPDFNSVVDESVTVTVVDDDAPGVVILAGALGVSEDGASATYQMQLSSQPQAAVTVEVVADNQVQTNKGNLVFSASNWNQPQTIQVKAVDDRVDEREEAAIISHRVSSTDNGYNGIVSGSVDVTVTDNDTATILVSPLKAKNLTEGASSTYEVVLGSQPTAAVQVAINTDGQTAATPAVLTFNAGNWNKPQVVRLQAADDQVDEVPDSQPSLVDHSVSSDDDVYQDLTVDTLTIDVVDNDQAGLQVSPVNLEMPIGGRASYDVVLLSQPVDDVLVEMLSSAEVRVIESCASDEGPTACVLFTPDNWNIAQAVTVRGMARGRGVINNAVFSADTLYDELNAAPVQVTIEGDAGIFMPVVTRR